MHRDVFDRRTMDWNNDGTLQLTSQVRISARVPLVCRRRRITSREFDTAAAAADDDDDEGKGGAADGNFGETEE